MCRNHYNRDARDAGRSAALLVTMQAQHAGCWKNSIKLAISGSWRVLKWHKKTDVNELKPTKMSLKMSNSIDTHAIIPAPSLHKRTTSLSEITGIKWRSPSKVHHPQGQTCHYISRNLQVIKFYPGQSYKVPSNFQVSCKVRIFVWYIFFMHM